MNSTTDVLYAVAGQEVETYPSEEEWRYGVPSAATVEVFDGDRSLDDAEDFSASATVDAVSTTVGTAFTAQTGNPRNKIYLASAASVVVGRHYLLENPSTQREMVTPLAVNTASGYVEVEDDLRFDHTTASTFKGLRMVFTVPTAWASTESNLLAPKSPSYKAVWSYTVNGLSRQSETYLRLVRQRARHGVTAKDVSHRWPDALDNEHRRYRGLAFKYAIEDAWCDFRFAFRTEGYEPSQIRDTELVDRIVLARTMYRLLSVPGTGYEQAQVDAALAEYGALFGKAVLSLHVPVDEGTEGAASVDPVQRPIWSR